MKTNIFVNYMLMALAWSLYLSRKIITAILVILLASVLLVLKLRHLNMARFFITFILSVGFFALVNTFSTISMFFGWFREFGIFVSCNLALSNEMLNRKSENMNDVHSLFSLVMLIFFVSAVLLPDSWYTLFTKANLYTLVACVFVPYEAALASSLLFKELSMKVAVFN